MLTKIIKWIFLLKSIIWISLAFVAFSGKFSGANIGFAGSLLVDGILFLWLGYNFTKTKIFYYLSAILLAINIISLTFNPIGLLGFGMLAFDAILFLLLILNLNKVKFEKQ